MTSIGATTRADALGPAEAATLAGLVDLALDGLVTAYDPHSARFAQTVRAVRTPSGVRVRPEGTNLRYAAIAALGLSRATTAAQHRVLTGLSADELAADVARRAAGHADLGAVALAAWASAEVLEVPDEALLADLATRLGDDAPAPTVDTAWALTAAVASLALDAGSAAAGRVRDAARRRLLAEQGPQGIFPHALPAMSLGRWRSHVGCFADQVYPIQALARLGAADADGEALRAAERCAARIVELQGPAGQWWWHYDQRNGEVVERYPVYSVHQHAMAPMALLDLAEAGGSDHTAAVARGLRWLDAHPEVLEDLVSPRHGLVWRKVGRREPPKAARRVAAVATSLVPGARLPGLDAALPAVVVDHECRPYELGWLLYAWLPPRAGAPGTEER
jgi:hypothetical protein